MEENKEPKMGQACESCVYGHKCTSCYWEEEKELDGEEWEGIYVHENLDGDLYYE